jgi:multidrug resistance efflux pump
MTDMQVKATVNEAKVTLVRPGLPVTIRVDALRDEIIEGSLSR